MNYYSLSHANITVIIPILMYNETIQSFISILPSLSLRFFISYLLMNEGVTC